MQKNMPGKVSVIDPRAINSQRCLQANLEKHDGELCDLHDLAKRVVMTADTKSSLEKTFGSRRSFLTFSKLDVGKNETRSSCFQTSVKSAVKSTPRGNSRKTNVLTFPVSQQQQQELKSVLVLSSSIRKIQKRV